jgi:hypothetical protein
MRAVIDLQLSLRCIFQRVGKRIPDELKIASNALGFHSQ